MATTTITNGAATTNGSTTEKALESLREALLNPETHAKKQWKDVEVEREGTRIILPEGMTYDHAIEWLNRRKETEEQEVMLKFNIEAYPLDGAVALQRAMNRIFGFTASQGKKFFGMEMPPRMMSVQTALDEHMDVVIDEIAPPGLEGGTLQVLFLFSSGKPVFNIVAQVKQKHRQLVEKVIELTREIVRDDSIYKGKAISVDLAYAERGSFDVEEDAPKYMNLKGVSEHQLILNKDVEFDLATSVYTRIEQTEECRRAGTPLKHGVLLMGPYGTGKTMTARVIARKAEENGWTFVYLKNASRFAEGLQFASQYAPAVLFCEDIDKAVQGERDEAMDTILNTLDGIDSKDKPILTVITTNNPEMIHPGFLRAGRIDTVIHVGKPDKEAASRFVQLYARDQEGRSLLEADVDLDEAGEALADMVPAFIAEGVHRAKMYAMRRSGSADNLEITTEDLVLAGTSLRHHIDLMEGNGRKEDGEVFDIVGELGRTREDLQRLRETFGV